jgi:heme-binding protein
MFFSGTAVRRAAVGVIGAGALAGAVLVGGTAVASADDVTPGCTAADLAYASGNVGTGMGIYLSTHPDVNDFFTSLRGKPNEEIRSDVQTYMDARPQVEAEINQIRSPLTDLRNRCDAPAPAMDSRRDAL